MMRVLAAGSPRYRPGQAGAIPASGARRRGRASPLLEGCREASDDYSRLRHDRRGRRCLHWLRGGIENIQDVSAIKNAFGREALQQVVS
jgi:hypothetical protein